MEEKDHIIEPVTSYDEVSHTLELQGGLKNEKIPKICILLDSIVHKMGTVIFWTVRIVNCYYCYPSLFEIHA